MSVLSLAAAYARTPTGKLRARSLSIPFRGTPGPLNSITDVAGVEVGHRTIVRGDGALVVGEGPVRTGVTAIHPRGRANHGRPVFAGVHSMNGNGEMTGFVWIEEAGRTELPIVLTNTHSVGLARDAVVKWMVQTQARRMSPWMLPVAAETYDGHLSDIDGFHVTDADVFAALEDAAPGAIDEGSVGGGTGMVCYEWKGGIGTASRAVTLGTTPGVVGGPRAGELWPARAVPHRRSPGRTLAQRGRAGLARAGLDHRRHRYGRAALAAPTAARREARHPRRRAERGDRRARVGRHLPRVFDGKS